MSKIIFYYQTKTDISDILKLDTSRLIVYFSSLHFGYQTDGSPYIHMNDAKPSEQPYLIEQMKQLISSGAKVMVMLGGAGGAYENLFSHYSQFYPLLKNYITNTPEISGIDLDVEESVNIRDIQKLIKNLVNDFGPEFIISMAPVAESLMSDYPGMGSFVYKDLIKSPEGKNINWFNVQVYGNFSIETLKAIIKNGYPSHLLVMGMLGDQYDKSDFPKDEITKMINQYPDLKGFDLWELGDSSLSPIIWSKYIQELSYLNNN